MPTKNQPKFFTDDDMRQSEVKPKVFTDEEMRQAEKPKFFTDEEMSQTETSRPSISVPDSEVGSGNLFTQEDVKNIVARSGGKVSEEFVKSQLPIYGTDVYGDKMTLGGQVAKLPKMIAGEFNEYLGNIPAAVYNWATMTEDERKAVDDIRELAQKKRTYLSDVTKLLGSVAVGGEAVKGVQALAKLSGSARAMDLAARTPTKIGVMTAEGAAYGAAEAKVGEAEEGAKLGAAFGFGLGAAAPIVSKFFKKADIDQALSKKNQEAANNIGLNFNKEKEILQETKGKVLDSIESYVKNAEVRRVVDATLEPFADQKVVPANIQDLRTTKAWGDRLLAEGSENQPGIRDEVLEKWATENYIKKLPDPSSISGTSNFFLSILDNLQAAKLLDGKWGTSLEKTFINLGERLNKAKTLTTKGNELAAKTKNLITDASDEQLIGKAGTLTPEETATKNLFDRLHKSVSDTFGISLPKIENFIMPRMTKNHQDWLVSLDAELQRLGIRMEQGTGGKWVTSKQAVLDAFDSNPESMKELTDHVAKMVGAGTKIDPTMILEAAFNQKRSASAIDDFNIARLMSRDDTAYHIPAWAVERNAEAAAFRWIRDVSKGVAVRDSLVQLSQAQKIAERSGDGGAATWLRSVIQDIKGQPRSEPIGKGVSIESKTPLNIYEDFANRVSANALLKIQRDPSLKNQALALFPHAANLLTRLPYPNLLSRPISAVKNISSPIFSTLPYLTSSGVGVREAASITLKSALDTARQINLLKNRQGILGGLKQIRDGEAETLARGLTHTQFTGDMAEKLASEAVRALKQDTVLGKIFAKSEKAEEIYSKVLLAGFQASETFARVMTMNIGKNLATRMAQHPEFGKKVLSSSDSPFLRNSRWVRQGVPEVGSPRFAEFQDEMVSWLNANTAFNYDRANMSGLGRYMGPLFSQFSKWPMMMLGKAAVPFSVEGKKEASLRVGQTLLMPILFGMAADRTAKELGLYDDPVYQTWVGSLQSYAPGEALVSLGRDDSLRSPIVKTLTNLSQSLSDPQRNAAPYLQQLWDYIGLGGLEKVAGAAYTTVTGEKAPRPSKEVTKEIGKSLKETLETK